MTDAPPPEAGSAQASDVSPAAPSPGLAQPSRPRKAGRRAPVPDPHNAWLPPWRVKPELRAKVLADAAGRGLTYGAFMRATFEGSPGPRARRIAPAEHAVLVRLLAELGKIGSNHNQLARVANSTGDVPDRSDFARVEAAIQAMRNALLKALGYGD
jgi:hypothetical protein